MLVSCKADASRLHLLWFSYMSTPGLSVSVAMATYNGERHIRRQLDSLAAQSHVPAQLVISDDNSEDKTVDAIKAFAETVSFPVEISRNETRLGYRANFMRAASLCRSELIAFCDQDDYWYPDKIAASVKPFDDPDVLLAYHNADVVSAEGKQIETLANFGALQSLLMPMSTGPWQFALGFTEVLRRSLLRFSDLWPNSCDAVEAGKPMAHDQWFFFLASVFGKIAYLDKPLVAYVQHATNTYGFWHDPGFWQAVKYQVRDRSDEYSLYAKAAESRAIILEGVRTGLDKAWAQRAVAAAEYYRKVSRLYDDRSTLYTSGSLGERLKAFRAILDTGGYTGQWGIKRKSVVVDMCLGVPLGHFMRSRAEPRQ